MEARCRKGSRVLQVRSLAQEAGWGDIHIDDLLERGSNRGAYHRGDRERLGVSSWLAQYYTAATARAALDYYAGDYVHLNLPLPAFVYELAES